MCFRRMGAVILVAFFAVRGDLGESPTDFEKEALFRAVCACDVAALRALIHDGADVNVRFGSCDLHILKSGEGWPACADSYTPLHALALKGMDSRVVNRSQMNSAVLLPAAVQNADQLVVASMLIRHGADVVAKDQCGYDALDIAFANRNDGFAVFLMALMHSAPSPDEKARVPLLRECFPYMPAALSFVIELNRREASGVDLNNMLRTCLALNDAASCRVLFSKFSIGSFDDKLVDKAIRRGYVEYEADARSR